MARNRRSDRSNAEKEASSGSEEASESSLASEDYETETEESNSLAASESGTASGSSLEDTPALFDVYSGKCPGQSDRIHLLLRQLKVVPKALATEELGRIVFDGIVSRSEAETTEEERWVTSLFSIVPYRKIEHSLPDKLSKSLGSDVKSGLHVFLSARFSNVPDEIICEMYAGLKSHFQLKESEKLLFLSAEAALSKEQESEVKSAFPELDISSLRGFFPVHPEEIFLHLGGVAPHVVTGANEYQVKAYLFCKRDLIQFIDSLEKYYEGI